MVGLPSGGGAGLEGLAALANPDKKLKELGLEAQRVQEERKKLDKSVREFGGIRRIKDLEQKAEDALKAAETKAFQVLNHANRKFSEREESLRTGEARLKDRDEEQKDAHAKRETAFAEKDNVVNLRIADATKRETAATRREVTVSAAEKVAVVKAAEAAALQQKLEAKAEQTAAIWS